MEQILISRHSIGAGGTMHDERPTKPLFCCEGAGPLFHLDKMNATK